MFAGAAVEIARRFIGEQHRGFRGEGPGDGHALLFAAGQLRRIMTPALAEPDLAHDLVGGFARIVLACQLERQHDVFQCIERGNQVEALEHETDAGSTNGRSAVFVKICQVV